MNTHDILLSIQYITISVLFLELLIVFLRWKNSVHSFLFLACLSSFISNMGYLLELKAGSEEAYLSSLKLSYVGRVWIVFAFFLFSARICKKRIPRGLLLFLVLLHIGIYLAVLSIGSNSLYYSEYRFIPDPVMPTFQHTNGVIHDLFMTSNCILAICSFVWIYKEFTREKNKMPRQRLFLLTMAFGVQLIPFILQFTRILPITAYYDLTMPGALVGTIFLLIAIIGFDLLGTREIARDFAIDRISEGIIAVDNEGRIQYYNEPAARIYPQFDTFFASDLHGKKASARRAALGPEPVKADSGRVYTPYDILSFITDAVKTGETLKVGDRIYTPEENDLQYKGESYGKLYALVDDTDHYRYMEELQKQRDIADSASEAKSRFLASMSHEIRTPINAVLGMDEMILRESNEKPIRGYAADIMSAGQTLLSLINDILDFSKVEEGKMEIIPVKYDLSSLINDLVNMTRDRAAKKGLKLRVDVDEHIPHLLIGDEIRIKQCAMNLLTNAVKYTETGEVTIAVSYEKKDQNNILLCFTVRDTGIGMKTEDMDNLFSPYKRIEEKRNRAIEGTGLGMSITRQLLELMGSSLKVESEYGRGSVFSFAINQEVDRWEELGDYSVRFSDSAAYTHTYRELFHAPQARILVVDDTEMNLTVIQSLLKKTAIVIDTAASGRKALELAADNFYDVIFIDHMMPDMDGIETLERLRESGKCKDTPAVALTANAVSGAREMYLEAGFTDYLSKPVNGEKLERMLYRMIPADKILEVDDTELEGTVPGQDTDAGNGQLLSGDAPGTAPAGLPDWLTNLREIDSQAGTANCGSEEGYLSVLAVFHQTAKTKADEIARLLADGDLENYTIKVHALKSSARIIGASALSALAKDLEDAGKRKDTAFIGENNDRLLDMYRALDAQLSRLDRAKDNLPAIEDNALKEAYQTIYEIAGCMDYGLMESILENLRGYRLAPADEEKVGRIAAMLTELDWDGIMQCVSGG